MISFVDILKTCSALYPYIIFCVKIHINATDNL